MPVNPDYRLHWVSDFGADSKQSQLRTMPTVHISNGIALRGMKQ